MMNDNKETITELWLRKLKNNPIIAVLIVLSVAIGGISAFTESASKIFHVWFPVANVKKEELPPLPKTPSESPGINARSEGKKPIEGNQQKDELSQSIKRTRSSDINVRIEGIKALGRLSMESDKHLLRVLNELGSFVRTQAQWKKGINRTSTQPDVQIALEIIGQLPKKNNRGDLLRVDMHNVDIAGAIIANANLEGVVLWGSNLRKVVLARANLRRADLGGVDFTDASLEMADLEGAFLWPSEPLEPVRPSSFAGTRMAGAILKDAHLENAILVNAIGLTEAQIRSAITNPYTKLPEGMSVRGQ